MIEEELAKHQAKEAGITAANSKQFEGSDSKKTFLKRKTENLSAKKGPNTTAKKSYKYYVDNFAKDGKVKFAGRGEDASNKKKKL